MESGSSGVFSCKIVTQKHAHDIIHCNFLIPFVCLRNEILSWELRLRFLESTIIRNVDSDPFSYCTTNVNGAGARNLCICHKNFDKLQIQF